MNINKLKEESENDEPLKVTLAYITFKNSDDVKLYALASESLEELLSGEMPLHRKFISLFPMDHLYGRVVFDTEIKKKQAIISKTPIKQNKQHESLHEIVLPYANEEDPIFVQSDNIDSISIVDSDVSYLYSYDTAEQIIRKEFNAITK